MRVKGLADAIFPEQRVDLKVKDAKGGLFWKVRSKWADGIVNQLAAPDGASTYLFRTIAAKERITVTGSFGSDDGCTVWLNGKRILKRDESRGVAPDHDKTRIHHRDGENRLLFKIYNTSGESGFFFRIVELTKG